jgi:DNA-binding MarR family transcriptional regulator
MGELLRAQLARDLQANSGLTDAEYAVLVELSEAADHRLRCRDLGRALVWSMSRVSHQLARMERRGLVVRQACDSDGRGTEVLITAVGLAALEQAAPAHVEGVRRNLLDLLSRDELRTLAAVAERVIEHLRAEEAPT